MKKYKIILIIVLVLIASVFAYTRRPRDIDSIVKNTEDNQEPYYAKVTLNEDESLSTDLVPLTYSDFSKMIDILGKYKFQYYIKSIFTKENQVQNIYAIHYTYTSNTNESINLIIYSNGTIRYNDKTYILVFSDHFEALSCEEDIDRLYQQLITKYSK